MENEVGKAIDVTQWKQNMDRGLNSKEVYQNSIC